PPPRDLAASTATWPLDTSADGPALFDFLSLRGPVRRTPKLDALLAALRPGPGSPAGELGAGGSRHIHTHFRYARDVTLASSPIDDILDQSQGVCQDFTHLMIAILRSFGVPARYVSGYIHRPEQESQSHAWCEAWLPDLRWVGVDPTNDALID